MKKSKSLFTRICQSFLKRFFTNTLFPYFLFFRTSKNFKRKINSEKQSNKFSNILDKINQYDISVNVKGGGLSGQAGAIRLGISRALILVDPENRPALKSNGLLTRDSRKVERKKPGQPGARKKFQFSKR